MSELFYLHWERFWLGVIYMVYKLARSAKAGLNTILPYSVLCLGMNLSRSESSARPRPAPRLRSPALLLLGNWRSAYIVGVPRTFFGAISCCSPAPGQHARVHVLRRLAGRGRAVLGRAGAGA